MELVDDCFSDNCLGDTNTHQNRFFLPSFVLKNSLLYGMPFSLISSVITSRSISHPGRCISDNLIPQHSGRSFGRTVTIKVSPCSKLAAKACLLLLLFY